MNCLRIPHTGFHSKWHCVGHLNQHVDDHIMPFPRPSMVYMRQQTLTAWFCLFVAKLPARLKIGVNSSFAGVCHIYEICCWLSEMYLSIHCVKLPAVSISLLCGFSIWTQVGIILSTCITPFGRVPRTMDKYWNCGSSIQKGQTIDTNNTYK